MIPHESYHPMIHLTLKEIGPLWCKFRDIEPETNLDLHVQYCEMIQEAMIKNETDEAFRLLVEGIQWYDSANAA